MTGRGCTDEQILAFAYGTNGRSVFINTVGDVLGDYVRSAPIETLTETSVERHPTELATLHGAR